MPRYIDADKLIELATHEGAYGYVDVHDICNVPTANVVEVVRCKNCVYWSNHSPWVIACQCKVNREVTPREHFCAFGRRMEKTDE